MKTFIASAAAAAAVVLGSTAYAQSLPENLSFVGQAEYAIEAEGFSTELGVEYALAEQPVTFGAVLLADNFTKGKSFDFAGVELSAEVEYTAGVVGYVEARFDEDFDYDETVLGISFKF